MINSEQEYFIRELTRRLEEQINSIRRELDNLKKAGLLKTKTKNGKKYYYVNKSFIFLEELKSMIVKTLASTQGLASEISKMGEVKVLALAGVFVENPTETVDMLIVGEVDREKLANYLTNEVKTSRPVKFTVITEEDYKFRLNCKDKFVGDILNGPDNQILINRL